MTIYKELVTRDKVDEFKGIIWLVQASELFEKVLTIFENW